MFNYDLCKSCKNFRPSIKTLEVSHPKFCACPHLDNVFGLPDGFPSGIQIIHCDYFDMFPASFGDVCINKGSEKVSYILTQPRNFKLVRIPQLSDNSQNIKNIEI